MNFKHMVWFLKDISDFAEKPWYCNVFKLTFIKLFISLNGETSQRVIKTMLAVCLMLI